MIYLSIWWEKQKFVQVGSIGSRLEGRAMQGVWKRERKYPRYLFTALKIHFIITASSRWFWRRWRIWTGWSEGSLIELNLNEIYIALTSNLVLLCFGKCFEGGKLPKQVSLKTAHFSGNFAIMKIDEYLEINNISNSSHFFAHGEDIYLNLVVPKKSSSDVTCCEVKMTIQLTPELRTSHSRTFTKCEIPCDSSAVLSVTVPSVTYRCLFISYSHHKQRAGNV